MIFSLYDHCSIFRLGALLSYLSIELENELRSKYYGFVKSKTPMPSQFLLIIVSLISFIAFYKNH
jgi:hypothetical protein